MGSNGSSTQDPDRYDPVAERFDQLSERYSRWLAAELAERTDLRNGDRVLDLGSGSGVAARQVLQHGSRCVAADASAGMLRAAAAREPRPEPVQLDASSLAFVDGAFDAVVSLFAVSHFRSPGAVVDECARVLAPGGVLTLAFGAAAPGFKATLARAPDAAWDRVSERVGRLQTAPRALEHFLADHLGADQLAVAPAAIGSDLERSIRQAGLEDLRSGWSQRRFEIESAEEFWEIQAVFSTPSRTRLATVPSELLERLRSEFIEQARRTIERRGRLVYDVGACWIRAQKPGGVGR